MLRPTAVHPREGYKIWVTFSDGVSGEIDLSDLVGKGVFQPLAEKARFSTVHLGDHGQIAWSEEMEICPDAVYREILGKRLTEAVHA
jgi:hypothetical protein